MTNAPALLCFRGEFLRDEMHNQRVREHELRTAVRKEDLGSLDETEAIVLETSDDISVVASVGDGSALQGVTSEQRTERTEGNG